MSRYDFEPLIVNGWRIFAHPLFLEQLDELAQTVQKLQRKDPENYQKKSATKILAAIQKLAFEIIPQDPARSEYRQGETLGAGRKHWFRAKFFQQYRLFFQFNSKEKVIVYVWVNDESTKRAYDSRADAYRVFKAMLENGHPPDDWANLIKQSKG